MKSQQFENWQSPTNSVHIKTLDCHTGGEPLRIITSGFPELQGNSILEKRRDCQKNHDHLRTSLMFEPRGHADMYGAIVVDAERDDSDFGAIFIHNEGYSTMCGHAVIALTKFAVESGIVPSNGAETRVNIDVPCGQIKATAFGENRVESVSFECVPSFILYKNESLHVPGLGLVKFDIAYGGAFYAYMDVSEVHLKCEPKHINDLMKITRTLKELINQNYNISHPTEDDLSFLYGVIYIDSSEKQGVHSKNICIFADNEVDRSPTGSGVSGRIAIHHEKGEVALNDSLIIESVLGSQFRVEAIKELDYHGMNAVIPRVTGTAHISGRSEFIIDPNDPLKDGFLLR